MSFELLATAIRTQLVSDTGTGGLFNTSSPLVNAVYTMRGPNEASEAYLLIEYVSESPTHAFDSTKKHYIREVQVTGYCTEEQGMERAQLIYDRLLARLDRWQPSITGYTCSQLIQRLGIAPSRDLDNVQVVASFEVHLSSG